MLPFWRSCIIVHQRLIGKIGSENALLFTVIRPFNYIISKWIILLSRPCICILTIQRTILPVILNWVEYMQNSMHQRFHSCRAECIKCLFTPPWTYSSDNVICIRLTTKSVNSGCIQVQTIFNRAVYCITSLGVVVVAILNKYVCSVHPTDQQQWRSQWLTSLLVHWMNRTYMFFKLRRCGIQVQTIFNRAIYCTTSLSFF